MSKLPEEFADLEKFSDWCLASEEDRYAKRLASTMAEMQELYDAGMKRLEDIMVYVDRKSTRLNSSHIQKSRMPSSA